MATTKLRVKVPPNSATLDEARKRVFDFFKTACRSLPTIMEIYNLYDVVTISQLRSTIAAEIRKNAHINNPKIIDMLVFKGMEELGNIVEHAKQRHHVIGQYVVGRQGLVQELHKDEGISPSSKISIKLTISEISTHYFIFAHHLLSLGHSNQGHITIFIFYFNIYYMHPEHILQMFVSERS